MRTSACSPRARCCMHPCNTTGQVTSALGLKPSTMHLHLQPTHTPSLVSQTLWVTSMCVTPSGVRFPYHCCIWYYTVTEPSFLHPIAHAGNLLVLRDGRVGFIDFGIVGSISPATWRAMETLMTSSSTSDYLTMARALATMGATRDLVDVEVGAVHACDWSRVPAAVWDRRVAWSRQLAQAGAHNCSAGHVILGVTSPWSGAWAPWKLET